MPPKKRTAGTTTSRRAKRLRAPTSASDMQEAGPSTGPSTVTEPPDEAGTLRLNVRALTNTIAAAVSQAVKDAIAGQQSGSVPERNDPSPATLDLNFERLVDDEVTTLTTNEGTQKSLSQSATLDIGDHPRQLFTSIGIDLGARVNSKLKAKIWANEFIDFGALLSVAPPREKFTLSMTSTGSFPGQPHLTLEPSHNPKKETNIQQWLTAFNTFVSIYSEKAAGDAPKLMKYCEVVRDLCNKSGDWIFYDEQFRYLRQSAPESYPWDQIHWELWLRAMTNFRGKPQLPASTDKATPRARYRSPTVHFPKGTCWTFHAGRQCRGCQYEHVCFKCGAKHPASQCQVSSTHHQRSNFGKSGPSANTQNVAQPTGHARKGGPV